MEEREQRERERASERESEREQRAESESESEKPKSENLKNYVATLREQLEELAEEKTPDGLPRVSKVQVNDYSEKIEAIASKLAIPVVQIHPSYMGSTSNRLFCWKTSIPVNYARISEAFCCNFCRRRPSKTCGESPILTSPKLRRRFMPQSNIEDKAHNSVETHQSASVKLDAVEQIHIEKHRKLQDDLTDEMVGLAQQLKESSLMMNQSIKNTEKVSDAMDLICVSAVWVLDSTEAAIEHSLASTGCASTRAMEIYSKSFKTACFTWLVIFVMTCIFIMVVLVIHLT
ncbi:hypothetical protein HYC85_024214 [Camellia sinensis]|uniref:Uncharacterized protein n=1 Tax=Camellia sinensis TaxID=4442 RepID=A0A7J7GB46_CAMSI|nr:hypothetical protein HYC85_024214 [Camellia sinensis]